MLREAAEELYLKQKHIRDKAYAVHALLSLAETEAPEEYQDWEWQHLSDKADHGRD